MITMYKMNSFGLQIAHTSRAGEFEWKTGWVWVGLRLTCVGVSKFLEVTDIDHSGNACNVVFEYDCTGRHTSLGMRDYLAGLNRGFYDYYSPQTPTNLITHLENLVHQKMSNKSINCDHYWVDMGTKKCFCKICNADGVWENGQAKEV